mgnify:FL=1
MSTSHREFYVGLERAAAARAGHTDAAGAQAVHQTLAADEGPRSACRSGCDHCCHFPVGVRFSEALLLAASISADVRLRAIVQRAAEVSRPKSWQELAGEPCPLLAEGHCARYDARPTPCRALRSFDADACRGALQGTRAVPRDERAWWRGLGAAASLDDEIGPRELRSAVASLLALGSDASQQRAAVAFERSRAVPGADR